eukprot:TRINITY_DN6311_c0_g1_i2.p1 TRINITY_DN6311_c0_g1~~TRINITY_DN6311_c0_g1_i2.p1  ORF type:complete len:303 (+),score=48.90 TRINITY_DN6311_c0_g1_i2:87-995(+)
MTSTKTFYSVSGPASGEVGSTATYDVNATTEAGAPKDVDISLLKGWVRGPRDFEGAITRSGVGSYHVTVRPTFPGTYYLDVTIGGRAILSKEDVQTQFKENAQLERPKICFELEGHGLHAGRVGEPATFSVRVSTPTGAPVDIDSHRLIVNCNGPDRYSGQVVRESIGNYTASLLVKVAGSYVVSVTYDGNNVLTQDVSFSSATTAKNSGLTSLPPARVSVGSTVRFTIQSRDANGGLVSAGGDEWHATATGPELVKHLTITDNLNGTYTGEVSFPAPGIYLVEVMLEGQPTQNSPIRVQAE